MGPYLGTPKKEKDSVDGENERVSDKENNRNEQNYLIIVLR